MGIVSADNMRLRKALEEIASPDRFAHDHERTQGKSWLEIYEGIAKQALEAK